MSLDMMRTDVYVSASDPLIAVIDDFRSEQLEAALLSDMTRHAILEIGDRLQQLHRVLVTNDRHARDVANGAERSESMVVAAFHDAVDGYFTALGREIGFPAYPTWRAASRYFHKRFGHLIALSPFAARCFQKPLGYAGDFEMMNMCYRNVSLGDTLFGRALTRVALDSEAGRAVRHRAEYLRDKIEATLTAPHRSGPPRILSVAAGPAMELQRLFHDRPDLILETGAEITLLDQDATALNHARRQIESLAEQAGGRARVRCLNTSIRQVIAGGLDTSYDLVYSAGLFDYLKDAAVRMAGARLVAALAPGGRAVIGNFAPVNPTRSFMELVLDWPLHHRSSEDLSHLFADLGSGMDVEHEATGVNLFAVIES